MSMNFIPAIFNAAGNYWEMVEGVETVNASNSNACEIARNLGCNVEDGIMETVEIDRFISKCQAFLRNHLGKPDAAVPTVIETPSQSTQQWNQLCQQHGNVMGKLQEMLNPQSGEVIRTTRDSGGPTIVHCGRPEGYLQERIRKILTSIQHGKELGATHVYAA